MRKGILLLSISLGLSFALECKNYRVREGDTLEKIAKREGVDLKSLKSANKDVDEKSLKPGQKLCIPVRASQKEPVERYAVYEVRKGDSLQKIANLFGVDVDTLKEFNNLKSDKLVEGQKLKIPARGTSVAKREKKEYEIYTVKRGGTLQHVSKAIGVPVEDLEELNPELKKTWLKPGTQVRVPKGSVKTEAKEEEKMEKRYQLYTVKKGARLEHVAKATDVPLKELEKLNPELKDKWLPAGTKVKVPLKETEQAKTHKKEEEAYEVYTVKRSGRLEDVARVTGVSLKELERLNPELKGKLLHAGTKVKIPKKETTIAEKPAKEIQQAPTRREERSIVGELERESFTAPAPKGLIIQLPVDGKVSKMQNGKGIEIFAPCFSPVRAVENGRVIYSGGDLQAYGNMVIVEHDNFISLYAYNETNLVRRGDRVSKGQVIARVGRKNNSEECTLRFELRNKEGVPLDPTEYIRDLQ